MCLHIIEFRNPHQRRLRSLSPRSHSRGEVRPRSVVVLAERLNELAAGSFTATAYLGAHAAMLVFWRMLVALVCACPTGGGARFEHRSSQVGVVVCVPGHDAAGGRADIRAVKASTDAFG